MLAEHIFIEEMIKLNDKYITTLKKRYLYKSICFYLLHCMYRTFHSDSSYEILYVGTTKVCDCNILHINHICVC